MTLELILTAGSIAVVLGIVILVVWHLIGKWLTWLDRLSVPYPPDELAKRRVKAARNARH